METSPGNCILLDFGHIWLRPDHVLLVTFHNGQQIGYRQACKLMDIVASISHDSCRPLVLDLSNHVSLTIEARLYLMSERAAELKRSLAFIVASPVNKWMSNWSVKLNRPSFRVRSFLTKDAAVAWSKNAFSYQHAVGQQLWTTSGAA